MGKSLESPGLEARGGGRRDGTGQHLGEPGDGNPVGRITSGASWRVRKRRPEAEEEHRLLHK